MPFSFLSDHNENRTARIWMDCRGSGPGAQASAGFYDLTLFNLFNVIHKSYIALCVLYPFLQLLLYLMFQEKELERFVFVFFLRATEPDSFSKKYISVPY